MAGGKKITTGNRRTPARGVLRAASLPAISEDQLQVDCVAWFRVQYASHARLIHHSENEGKRGFYAQRRIKAMGMQAGFPDLFIAVPRCGYHGLFVELKSKTGRVRDSQTEMLSLLSAQGYRCVVVRTLLDFIRIVDGYMHGREVDEREKRPKTGDIEEKR